MPESTPETANFALQALEYGVLGLCAITLVLVVSIIRTEQKRDGYPRRGIIQLCLAFMVFSILLAGLNSYVQLQERTSPVEETEALQEQLRLSQAASDSAALLISDYKEILIGLDTLIDVKVDDAIMRPEADPVLRSVAEKLKNATERAREKGLLDP